jgi:hypothetical protein
MPLFPRTSDPWSGVDDYGHLFQRRFDLLDRLGICICGLPSRHWISRAGQVGDRLLVRRVPHVWQPLGSVAPAISLIAKCFRCSPARPVNLCGTAAVARGPAARARNSLMRKTSPILPTTWYDRCFVWSYSRRSSGMRPRLLGSVSAAEAPCPVGGHKPVCRRVAVRGERRKR